MNAIERRTRLAATAERLRDESVRIEKVIENETDNWRIQELDYAMQATRQAAVVLENLSIPESEESVVIRQLKESCRIVGEDPRLSPEQQMELLRKAREK